MLEDHLKNRCNSRSIPIEYIKYNFNCANEIKASLDFIDCSLFKQFNEVAKIIENEYEKVSVELFNLTKTIKEIDEHLKQNDLILSNNSKKHLIQVSSIIG